MAMRQEKLFCETEPLLVAAGWGWKKRVVCLTGFSVGEDKAHMPPTYWPLSLGPYFLIHCSNYIQHMSSFLCLQVKNGTY